MAQCILLGAPIDAGQKRPGCLMGPAAYRVAGLSAELRGLGHGVADWGDLAPAEVGDVTCANPAVHSLAEVVGWTRTLMDRVDDALSEGACPSCWGAIIRWRWGRWPAPRPMPRGWTGRCSCCGWTRIPISTRR